MTDSFMPATDSENKELSNLTSNASSRRLFLRRSLVGAALVAPAGLLAACGGSSSTTTSASTRTTNVMGKPTSPSTTNTTLSLRSAADSKAAFDEIMSDEKQHVQFLQGELKSAARPKPTFQKLAQSDVQSFARIAQQLENVGVGAYLMAAPAITNKNILAAAGSILTVEARHAGFLDALLQKPISANGAFDKPMTQAEIATAITPFIASLNGGAEPSATLKSDDEILNFILLLEFLEAEFYNTNVAKLFA